MSEMCVKDLCKDNIAMKYAGIVLYYTRLET